MDKLEILLDMIEHPERYTDQQISDLLADEEIRKHYDVMVRLRGAYDVKKVKSERVNFRSSESNQARLNCRVVTKVSEAKSEKYILPEESDTVHKGNSYFSLFTFHFSSKKIAAIFIAVAFLGGIALAAYHFLSLKPENQSEEVTAPSLTGRVGGESSLVRFADLRLDSILAVVGSHYGRAVCFRDTQACGLRLHTTWNRTQPLDSFVVTLNEFEVLKLTDEHDTLFVESVAEEVVR